MKIYTKTGDQGETSLLGGKRVIKDCIDIDAIGEVDELNSIVGMLLAEISGEQLFPVTPVKDTLRTVQHRLFVLGAQIANAQIHLERVPMLTAADIAVLETWIDEMEKELPALTQFILPGGHRAAALSFLARAVCRRAERRVVSLSRTIPDFDPLTVQFLNRLSDALFVLGRWLNKKTGHEETQWQK